MERGRRARHVLDHHVRSAAMARQHVSEACEGLSSDVVDVAVLLTSELVGNAVQHGRGAIVLIVERNDHRLRVEVQDDGPGAPAVASRGPLAHDGRGLMLVEALATEWGIYPKASEAGTRVWFGLATSG